jgi:RNA polymerase sigma-70 factor (ECF subfamily)
LPSTRDSYAGALETLLVGLARTGDRDAFAELVRRRQSWIRNLMRRCCGDATLADDLAQQVFLQAWRKIHHLREANRFGAWLKRLAITVWLQHMRAKDALKDADEYDETIPAPPAAPGLAMDLDRALASLSEPVRICIVLAYHEGMSHEEIAEITDLPLGTVKSHIRRGAQRLREILSDYRTSPESEMAP